MDSVIESDVQRIETSATMEPLEAVAEFLVAPTQGKVMQSHSMSQSPRCLVLGN